MTRYHFDLWISDSLTVDNEGHEYPDRAAVQWGAVLALVDLSRDIPWPTDLAIDVRDDAGLVIQVTCKHHPRRSNWVSGRWRSPTRGWLRAGEPGCITH